MAPEPPRAWTSSSQRHPSDPQYHRRGSVSAFATTVRAPRPTPIRGRGVLDFEQAYDENIARVYGFFAYRVGSRDDAEDLTQQTFERALRAWERFDPDRAAVGTWLLAIGRNLLIDHYRSRAGAEGTSVPLDDVDPHTLPSVDGAIALGLEPELAKALACLGQREREILALRYGADLTGPEVAELTGLSLANVQQIISRSLRRLRAALES